VKTYGVQNKNLGEKSTAKKICQKNISSETKLVKKNVGPKKIMAQNKFRVKRKFVSK